LSGRLTASVPDSPQHRLLWSITLLRALARRRDFGEALF
jgi:hypothetical protein